MSRPVIIISFFLLTNFLVSSCGNNGDIDNLSKKDQPKEVTYSVVIYYSDLGRSKLRLVSPEVHRYNDKDSEILECPIGMELTFFDSLQNVESVLISDYGKMFTDEKYLFVKDEVVFYNNKQDTLFTDLLHIYFNKDSLYTDKGVKVSSINGVVHADELIANSNFTYYQLLNIKDSHITYEEQ